MNNEVIMYILVNMDLPMEKGKIASQVAHSACDVVKYLTLHPNCIYKEWNKTGKTKIVLKSNYKQMSELIENYKDRSKEIWCDYTEDFGRTQVARGSLTTIAFNPIRRNEVPNFIRKLKLLQ